LLAGSFYAEIRTAGSHIVLGTFATTEEAGRQRLSDVAARMPISGKANIVTAEQHRH
jgi:hypothetical protein